MIYAKKIKFRDKVAHNVYISGGKVSSYVDSFLNSIIGTSTRLLGFLIGSKDFHTDHKKIFTFKTNLNIAISSEKDILDDVFNFANKVVSHEINIHSNTGKQILYDYCVKMGRIWSGMANSSIWFIDNEGYFQIKSVNNDENIFHPSHVKLQLKSGQALRLSKIDTKKLTKKEIEKDAIFSVLFGLIPYYFVDDQDNVPVNLPMSNFAKMMTAVGNPKASCCVPIKNTNQEIIGVYIVTRNEKTPNMQEKYGRSLMAFADFAGAVNSNEEQTIILKKLFQLPAIRIFEKEIAKQFTEKKLISAGGFTTDIKPAQESGINLFADVKNATGIADKLQDNPEDFAFLINSYLEIFIKSALRFDFRVDNIIGDGIFAQFYETFYKSLNKDKYVPSREETFALSTYLMIDVYKKLNLLVTGHHTSDKERRFLKILQETHEEFSIRMGIATGPAIITPLGHSNRNNVTAIGHYVNLAARLESNGAPGQIQTHKDFYMEFANNIINKETQRIFNILMEQDPTNEIHDQYAIERNFLSKNKKATIQKLFIENFRRWDPKISDLNSLYEEVNSPDIIFPTKQNLKGIGKNIPTYFISWDRKLPVNVYFDTISIFSSQKGEEEKSQAFLYLLQKIEFYRLAQKAAIKSLESLGIDPILINDYYEMTKKHKKTEEKIMEELAKEKSEESFNLIRKYTT